MRETLTLKASFLVHSGRERIVGTACVFEEYGAMDIPTGKWIVTLERNGSFPPNEEFKSGAEAIARALEITGWSAQNVAQAELDAEDSKHGG